MSFSRSGRRRSQPLKALIRLCARTLLLVFRRGRTLDEICSGRCPGRFCHCQNARSVVPMRIFGATKRYRAAAGSYTFIPSPSLSRADPFRSKIPTRWQRSLSRLSDRIMMRLRLCRWNRNDFTEIRARSCARHRRDGNYPARNGAARPYATCKNGGATKLKR